MKKKKSKLQKKKDNPNSSYWSVRALKKWSEIIRSIGYCEKCKSTKALNAHHLQSKRWSGTKYRIENGICLCPSCHKFGKESAHSSMVFYEWLRVHKQEQWNWVINNFDIEEERSYEEIYNNLFFFAKI